MEPAASAHRRLLGSDLDGTLLCVDPSAAEKTALARFNEQVRETSSLVLAFVTGRHLALGLEGIQLHGLDPPDYFICDVGTSIHRRDGDSWQVDEQYNAILKRSWKGLDGRAVAALLSDISELVTQAPERQSAFKRSYVIPCEHKPEKVLRSVEEALSRERATSNLVYSVDPASGTGLLDVLPAGASKESALTHLLRVANLDRETAVYAGDSGNDLAVFSSGIRSIVVANAPEKVRDTLRRHARIKGIADRIYFARQSCVQGVLEGCAHFGVFATR